MTRRTAVAVLVLAMCAAARPLKAHHSFAAEYDKNKPVTLVGAVSRIEWANPHVYFYLDVKPASGPSATWAVEGANPSTLYRAGWRKDSLKIGDIVTVHGYLARDGSKLANMSNVILADGREVLGSSQDGGPTSPPPWKRPGN